MNFHRIADVSACVSVENAKWCANNSTTHTFTHSFTHLLDLCVWMYLLVSSFPFLIYGTMSYKIYQLNLANSYTLLKTYKIHKNEIENNWNDYSLSKSCRNGYSTVQMWCYFKNMELGRCGKQCIECNNTENSPNKISASHNSRVCSNIMTRKWKRDREKNMLHWKFPLLFIYEMPHHAKNSVKYQFGKLGFSRMQNFGEFGLNIFHHLFAFYFSSFHPKYNLI